MSFGTEKFFGRYKIEDNSMEEVRAFFGIIKNFYLDKEGWNEHRNFAISYKKNYTIIVGNKHGHECSFNKFDFKIGGCTAECENCNYKDCSDYKKYPIRNITEIIREEKLKRIIG